jgi:acyl transferase domain-containing protein/phosphopantetheinyl transferase
MVSHSNPASIAIIGMECVFPGARDLAAFWSNIVRGVDAITELPPTRWDPASFDLPPLRAGCLDGLTDFDPLEVGVIPAALDEGDPEQFLVLGVIHRALWDAFDCPPGTDEPVIRGRRRLPQGIGDRTELVIGRGGYMGHGIEHLHLRMEVVDQLVQLLGKLGGSLSDTDAAELRRLLDDATPPLTAESVTAALPNLNAGRAANRLDLMGASYTVDAACASALVAVDNVVRSLREGRCDLGVAAAVHINLKPSIWRAFETLGVLSPDGTMRPFDGSASGLVMGEGIGAVVLKRLEDAERDQNRVYAVVRGVGLASDGRATGLLNPNLAGEVLALRRAYEEADVDPQTVSLIEGHGTATPVGDRTEIAALREVLGDRAWPTVALGSVKSMIGHAMPAAGMAGLIKAALALYHRTLPPTLNVDEPNPDLEGSALYVNTATMPWIFPPEMPRRAGINAFGFGGINAHAVLEEAARPDDWISMTPRGFELILLAADTRDQLGDEIVAWQGRLETADDLELRDVGFTAARAFVPSARHRLAVVAADVPDLAAKLDRARRRIADDHEETWVEEDGLYFGAASAAGKTAVVFPGIGFPGLAGGFTRRLGELCLHFPVAQELLDLADTLLFADDVPYPLHCQFFPPPLIDPESHTRIEHELGWSARTPTAFVMANLAGWAVVDQIGLRPEGMVGFSLGELVALIAAGAFETSIVDRGYLRRIQRMEKSLELPPKGDTVWAMVAAPTDTVETVLERFEGRVSLAMDVAPSQTFIAGETAAVRAVLEQLGESGIWSQELPQLPMLQPFFVVHTPAAKRIADRYWEHLTKTLVHSPALPVYSGSTGRRYSSKPRRLRRELLDSMTGTVRIRDVVESMYEEGFRVFVQLGAGGKLLANIHNTLAPRPHAAIAIDLEARGGLEQLLHALARLAALGVPFDPVALFRHQRCNQIISDRPAPQTPGARQLSLEPPRLDAERAAAAVRQVVRISRSQPTGGDGQPDATVPGPPTTSPDDLPAIFERLLDLQVEHDRAERRMLEGLLDVQRRMVELAEEEPEESGSPSEASTGDRAAPESTPFASAFPMLGTVHRLEPGRELEARIELDLDKQLFLNDHTFVNLPDDLKPPEQRLPTLPLTFGLEIIAEAAQTVVPDLELLEIRDVEAKSWISLEDSRTLALRVSGRLIEEGVVRVEVAHEGEGRPSLVGSAVLGERRPEQPAPIDPTLDRPSPYTGEEFYATGPLFHGPKFRVIRELLEVGENAASAEIVISDPQTWFPNPPAAGPILEPVLLDGLAQVAGFRAWLDGVLVLPVSLERLAVFAKLPAPGSAVRGIARLRHDDGRLVDIDIDAVSTDGQLLLRLEGLRSWRVFCPPSLLELNHRPRELEMSHRWTLPDGDCCFEVSRDDLGDLGPDWIARLYLGGDEWQRYRKHRRTDWLLGRIAVKDALRDWLRGRRDRTLHPLEIALDNSDSGAPMVIEPRESNMPSLSIAHLDDQAVAIISESGAVGIDLVAVEDRSTEFVITAFAESERELIEASAEGAELSLHRAWAAKEAAAKALGWGLDGLAKLRVADLHGEGARVETAGGERSLAVVTSVTRDRVLAVARLSP